MGNLICSAPQTEFSFAATSLDEKLINKTKLSIMQGDISEEDVDGIVNPTTSEMKSRQGVSYLIISKGGERLRNDIREMRESKGLVANGGAIITHGGDLQTNYIIHAVVPTNHNLPENEERWLKEAVTNCLQIAQEYKMKTLSFPPLFHRESSVRGCDIMLASIFEFLRGEVRPHAHKIRNIRIISQDNSIVRLFKIKLNIFWRERLGEEERRVVVSADRADRPSDSRKKKITINTYEDKIMNHFSTN